MAMLVHPRLVVQEVDIHSEGSLDWSVGHYLLHDLLWILWDAVCLAPMVKVVLIGDRVRVLTVVSAAWCLSTFRTLGSVPLDVVFTWGNLIWLAPLCGVVCPTRHQPSCHPILECRPWETSIAPKAADVAARHKILRRVVEVLLGIAVDARAVTHHLHCTECLKSTGADDTLYNNLPSTGYSLLAGLTQRGSFFRNFHRY